MAATSEPSFVPERAIGLQRLRAFLPRAGRDYARHRNEDRGPGDRSHVSAVSPWVRHRLVTEREIVAAALERFTYAAAEKFLQEVCWRTYWKGWLEMRPAVWGDYRVQVDQGLRELDRGHQLRACWEDAVIGRTGIDCFDAWVQELVEIGYLHNHARMWFASIWIFTLRLPWALGADFFFRHLLDGDPASNTLSWRWVAGLQTRGKTYLARPGNIAKYTGGRFHPVAQLATVAEPLEGADPPPPRPIPLAPKSRDQPCGLLLTEEDNHAESLPLTAGTIRTIAGWSRPADRSPLEVGVPAARFAKGAVADGLRRARDFFEAETNCLGEDRLDESVLDWAKQHGLKRVITPYAPIGPTAERLASITDWLDQHDIALVQLRRPWDDVFWPFATKGYFTFKKHIPGVLAAFGLLNE